MKQDSVDGLYIEKKQDELVLSCLSTWENEKTTFRRSSAGCLDGKQIWWHCLKAKVKEIFRQKNKLGLGSEAICDKTNNCTMFYGLFYLLIVNNVKIFLVQDTPM